MKKISSKKDIAENSRVEAYNKDSGIRARVLKLLKILPQFRSETNGASYICEQEPETLHPLFESVLEKIPFPGLFQAPIDETPLYSDEQSKKNGFLRTQIFNKNEEIREKVFSFLQENPDFRERFAAAKILMGRQPDTIDTVYAPILAMMPEEIFGIPENAFQKMRKKNA